MTALLIFVTSRIWDIINSVLKIPVGTCVKASSDIQADFFFLYFFGHVLFKKKQNGSTAK